MKDLITIADLDRWGACERGNGRKYSDAYLEKILCGSPGLTRVEVLQLHSQGVPYEDIVWVICHEEVLGEDLYKQFAHICADRAVENYALHCGIEEAELWAAKWINGDDKTSVSARNAVTIFARHVVHFFVHAACFAAWAALFATNDEVYEAALNAVMAAAIKASYAASCTADGDAIVDAACIEERKWQVQQLIKLINEQNNATV